MLSIKKLSFWYDEDHPLFEDVSFKVTKNDRMVIVGENGAGKSTLLKIIAGKIEPEEGSMSFDPGVRVLYVFQEFDGHQETIEDYIKERTKNFNEASNLIAKFGFDMKAFDTTKKLCGSLSGGQQKALQLSVAFAEKPSIILLDEPENHLDIVARKHLLETISSFHGAVLLISHDQTTLTTVVNKTVEIIDAKAYFTEGGYHEYKKARAARVAQFKREQDTLKRKAENLQSALVIMHQKAFRGKSTGDYHTRKDELAELKQVLKEKKNGPSDDQSKKLGTKIQAEDRSDGRFVWRSKDLRYTYEGHTTHSVNSKELEVRFGDRIGIIGRNGAGKSTLINLITGKLTPTYGEMTFAPDISFEVFNQHMHLPEQEKLVDVVCKEENCTKEEAYKILGTAKLSGKNFQSLSIADLSGGQRMRLRFALAFSKPLDLIILDEPTNNLDESTLEILKDLINNFEGAVLMITHDKAFLEELKMDKFWVIKRQEVYESHKDLESVIREIERS